MALGKMPTVETGHARSPAEARLIERKRRLLGELAAVEEDIRLVKLDIIACHLDIARNGIANFNSSNSMV